MDLEVLQQSMQTSLIGYAIAMKPHYVPAAHHRLIAEKLEQAFRGEISRLMIFAPPRHGKTELVSKLGPAWFMGNNPHLKIIAASHTSDLAEDNGGEVRDLLADPLHAATFGRAGAINPKNSARDNFRTLGKGEYRGVGVGGSPVGRGGDVIIIDDPIKSREEAESPTYRAKLRNWYTSALYSRRETNIHRDGVIILMHQRWHEDDLAGWLISRDEEKQWEILNLPALAEDYDELGRVPGEALWWEKFDEDFLTDTAKEVGPRDFMSMYQQRPRSLEGDEFKREYLMYYERTPEEVRRGLVVYILVDAASSKKKTSDYTAMAVIGLGADGNNYLLDGIRDRLKLSERAEMLMALHRKWRPRFVGYEQYGQMADIEHMQSVMEQDNYRFPITPLGGKMRKEERIRRMLPDLEKGKWFFPKELWKRDTNKKLVDVIDMMIEQEMLAFPVGKNDDFIDAMSRIYDMTQIRPKPGGGGRTGVSKGGPRPY